MDIPSRKRSNRKVILIAAGILLLLSSLAWSYARYSSFSQITFVDRSSVVISEVTRADLVREVRAPGRLVPAELRWVAATSNARVKEIVLDPGDPVQEDSIVMILDNPDLEQELDSAKLALEVAEAEYRAQEQRLVSERLARESVVAEIEAAHELAEFRKKANELLAAQDSVSVIALNEAVLEEKQLKTRHALALRQLDSMTALHSAELAARRARVNQSSRALQLQQKLFDELQVRAEFRGDLQDIPVEQGQQVAIGTILARVADNESLKTELRVQESQVKDVQPGQPVLITAGGNAATGIVRRIEPEVQEGVVIVVVHFDEKPLVGARSDLRVDGVIQLEKLDQVLKLRRPVFSQENASISLFVLDPGGQTATRRLVRIGRASTDEIEIVEGLNEGEQVIVSDTSRYNDVESFTLR